MDKVETQAGQTISSSSVSSSSSRPWYKVTGCIKPRRPLTGKIKPDPDSNPNSDSYSSLDLNWSLNFAYSSSECDTDREADDTIDRIFADSIGKFSEPVRLELLQYKKVIEILESKVVIIQSAKNAALSLVKKIQSSTGASAVQVPKLDDLIFKFVIPFGEFINLANFCIKSHKSAILLVAATEKLVASSKSATSVAINGAVSIADILNLSGKNRECKDFADRHEFGKAYRKLAEKFETIAFAKREHQYELSESNYLNSNDSQIIFDMAASANLWYDHALRVKPHDNDIKFVSLRCQYLTECLVEMRDLPIPDAIYDLEQANNLTATSATGEVSQWITNRVTEMADRAAKREKLAEREQAKLASSENLPAANPTFSDDYFDSL